MEASTEDEVWSWCGPLESWFRFWSVGFVPVTTGERYTALLPDDVWFWVSSYLAVERDASSLHELLHAGFPDEERGDGVSAAHCCHRLLLCLYGNTEGHFKVLEQKLHFSFFLCVKLFVTHIFSSVIPISVTAVVSSLLSMSSDTAGKMYGGISEI